MSEPVDIVLATHNAGKVRELRRILDGVAPGHVRLLSAADVDLPDVDETGETFTQNALLKARSAVAACGLACLADDSGLAVTALAGRPGVRSARYAGSHGDDEANLRLVLEHLDGAADRSASFVCVAAFVTPQGEETTAEGRLTGTLTTSPRGTDGFGYDPIFVPAGEQRTTAELRPEEKDAISHRGQAFRAIAPAVAAYAATLRR